jgi:hypothetical protein
MPIRNWNRRSCDIGLDDGANHQDITLANPNTGVYLGVELWHTMKNFSENCILLVLASDVYHEDDYIRDYDEFLKYIDEQRQRQPLTQKGKEDL